MDWHTTTREAIATWSGFGQENFDGKCEIYIIDSDEGLASLEQEWNKLLSKVDSTVFQTYEWLQTWWKYFGSGSTLHCLVFRFNSRVVGIAPLYLQKVRLAGATVARRLQFIGCGLSDYVDVLIAPGYKRIVLDRLARHLKETAETWDIFDIEDVNEQSPLVTRLPGVLERYGMTTYPYQGNVCPRYTLPSGGDHEVNGKDPIGAYNFRRKFKKLQQNSCVEIELFKGEQDDIYRAVEMFSILHGERWKTVGHPSAFDSARHMAFHAEVARKIAKRGWLRLYFLRVNNAPVAVSFNFNYNDRIFMYQANAYGPEAVMKCSPGFLLRAITISDGIKEGMATYDFLRGNEPYKHTEWETVDSKNWLLRIASPSRAGKVRFAAFLACEFNRKCGSRLRREYYDFKRFWIANGPNLGEASRYAYARIGELLALGAGFIHRHSALHLHRILKPGDNREAAIVLRPLLEETAKRETSGIPQP